MADNKQEQKKRDDPGKSQKWDDASKSLTRDDKRRKDVRKFDLEEDPAKKQKRRRIFTVGLILYASTFLFLKLSGPTAQDFSGVAAPVVFLAGTVLIIYSFLFE